jgi:hypothetical protein
VPLPYAPDCLRRPGSRVRTKNKGSTTLSASHVQLQIEQAGYRDVSCQWYLPKCFCSYKSFFLSIILDSGYISLWANKTLPCDKSHGKGAYMPGKVFAVRGRTATSARQRYRRQRGHCRALRVVCTATSLPCVLSFAVSPRVCRAAKRCRASTTLPCDESLPCAQSLPCA